MSAPSPVGGCQCNAVSFRVNGRLGAASACHCSQCRRVHGHAPVSAPAIPETVEIEGDITWYASSAKVRRAFCPTCGSRLFWQEGNGPLWVYAGALDPPSGTELAQHVYCASKGDYYDLAEELPQFDGAPDMPTPIHGKD